MNAVSRRTALKALGAAAGALAFPAVASASLTPQGDVIDIPSKKEVIDSLRRKKPKQILLMNERSDIGVTTIHVVPIFDVDGTPDFDARKKACLREAELFRPSLEVRNLNFQAVWYVHEDVPLALTFLDTESCVAFHSDPEERRTITYVHLQVSGRPYIDVRNHETGIMRRHRELLAIPVIYAADVLHVWDGGDSFGEYTISSFRGSVGFWHPESDVWDSSGMPFLRGMRFASTS